MCRKNQKLRPECGHHETPCPVTAIRSDKWSLRTDTRIGLTLGGIWVTKLAWKRWLDIAVIGENWKNTLRVLYTFYHYEKNTHFQPNTVVVGLYCRQNIYRYKT
jgi:hypothetical protein